MSRLNMLSQRHWGAAAVLLLMLPSSAWAADSYRWFHVTIETPWAIFIFLLPMVLAPLVLMMFLYWRFAGRSADKKNERRGSKHKKVETSSTEIG